jgi:hypothetical protein
VSRNKLCLGRRCVYEEVVCGKKVCLGRNRGLSHLEDRVDCLFLQHFETLDPTPLLPPLPPALTVFFFLSPFSASPQAAQAFDSPAS